MPRRVVGRDSEISRVRSAIGKGASVALVGPAGIGKSAIAAASLDGIPHDTARGLATLKARPYAPFEPVVHERLTGDPVDVAERLVHRLDGVLLAEDLHWFHPTALEVLGLLVGRHPIVMTSRAIPNQPTDRALTGASWIAVEPLSETHADVLSRRFHPCLPEPARRRLITAAGGVPLLIEHLVDATDGTMSATLRDATAERLSKLDPAARRTTELVALLGRPAPAELAGELEGTESDLLMIHDDGSVELSHAAIARAVIELIEPETLRELHRRLADRLDDAEGSGHDLAAGDHARAAERATRAAAATGHAGERATLLTIAADATAALDLDDRELRVRAAESFVEAGQWQEAIDQAGRIPDDGSLLSSDALLQRARAHWNAGDVDEARELLERASSIVSDRDDDRAARIVVERGYLEVRDRTPGAAELIASAVDATVGNPVEHLRARSSHGAALLYDGDAEWEQVLRKALDDAEAEPELAATIAYHLISGLGFHGRYHEAMVVDEQFIEHTTRHGLRRSLTHFQQAALMHRSMIDPMIGGILADADAHLAAHPLFRNRFLVHLVKALALLDLGRFDDARDAIDTYEAEGCHSREQTTTLAALRAELAWHVDDPDLARSALALGRPVADAYFGLHLLTERTVAHVLAAHDAWNEPVLPTVSMPAWWPALHELRGLERLAAADAIGAVVELQRAADCWESMGVARWAVRTGTLAAKVASARDRRKAHGDRHRYVDLARSRSLVGTLRRIGHAAHPDLTLTEERVLREVAGGASTRVVAERLRIAPVTVDQHVESARRKLGARTRLEAALMVEP